MLEKIEKIAKQVCNKNKVALYDIELKHASKGLIIIIYITKINDVTVEECQKVSRAISDILDEQDFGSSKYFLEVSSPGLERDLKLKKHYLGAIGEKVKLTFSNGKKNIKKIGVLKEVLPDVIKMDFVDATAEIPLVNIKKARVYFDYKKDLKDRK